MSELHCSCIVPSSPLDWKKVVMTFILLQFCSVRGEDIAELCPLASFTTCILLWTWYWPAFQAFV